MKFEILTKFSHQQLVDQFAVVAQRLGYVINLGK